MPAFNAGKTIDASLRSALSQEGVDLEVIVVDDGSSDDTVARASAHGPRVQVLRQANAGPQVARNRAIEQARGEFVAFLDSDDLWLPGKLQAQLKVLRGQPEVAAVFSAWHFWHPDASGQHQEPVELLQSRVDDRVDAQRTGWLYNPLLLQCCMLTTTVMVRTQTLRELGGFDTSLRVGEDYDLWLRLSRLGPIVKLASVGALYRVTVGSASRRPHERNWELEVLQRAVARWGYADPSGRQQDPSLVQARLLRLEQEHAGQHLDRGDPQVAWRGYSRLLRAQPLQPRWWLKCTQAVLRGGLRRSGAPAR